jgi:hypothetical protein
MVEVGMSLAGLRSERKTKMVPEWLWGEEAHLFLYLKMM